MSASTSEVLTIQKRLFDNSPVTPAARANDTTDIHIIRGSRYPTDPSLPFRTATLDHIQCGHLDCKPEERHLGANLGLYSITFNNDTVLDREALEEYKPFRLEAERKGFRHFLEVFDPNRPEAVEASQVPAFINDAIVRTLGGVTSEGPAALPQDGLPRPQGDGGTGPLRPAPGRRHPRRLAPAPPTTPSSCSARRRSTAPASPCSAARSTTPRTSSPSSASCA